MPEAMPSGTLRDLLEQHRKNPVCASCHDVMDPLGFGLEGYDGVGSFRTEDTGGFAIDAASVGASHGSVLAMLGALSALLVVRRRRRVPARTRP